VPEDPRDLAGLRQRLDERFPHGGGAACALDVLAHDRAAQAAGVPLRTFLGLAPGEAPPTSFTIGIAEPALMGERAAAAKRDGINVKLQKCGGIAEARAMIERAHELGLKVMLGCRAAETSVAIAAAAHLAPAVEWADLDGNLLITDDPFVAVPVERGRFVFSDRPGLGVVPRT